MNMDTKGTRDTCDCTTVAKAELQLRQSALAAEATETARIRDVLLRHTKYVRNRRLCAADAVFREDWIGKKRWVDLTECDEGCDKEGRGCACDKCSGCSEWTPHLALLQNVGLCPECAECADPSTYKKRRRVYLQVIGENAFNAILC